MQRNKVSSEDEGEMISRCIGTAQTNKNIKPFERICKLFLKQISDSEKLTRNQGANITIKIYSNPSDKSGYQTSQMFIISCLLYIFVKYRYLKVAFEQSSKLATKAADNEKHIWLNKKKTSNYVFPQFYKQFMVFIQAKSFEQKQTHNFFDELYFQMKPESLVQKQKENVNIRAQTYNFISQFYTQLNNILVNSKIYLMKNTLSCFKKDQDQNISQKQMAQEKQSLKNLLSQTKNIYILSHNFYNIPSDILNVLANQEPSLTKIQKQQKMIQQDQFDKGAFKQFQGTSLQYLQTLSFTIKGQISQINSIRRIVQNTPNLSFLFIKRNLNPQKIVDNINQLVETIIRYCPLIKRFKLQNIRVQNIELSLLQQLYQNCPFLIDFQIGLTFTFSIPETYSNNPLQDKRLKEKQRQIQILLEALRLRNLTLHNSILTVKLLLKKQYNFLSALEIVDCIEPIVL